MIRLAAMPAWWLWETFWLGFLAGALVFLLIAVIAMAWRDTPAVTVNEETGEITEVQRKT